VKELPSGWSWTTLGELGVYQNGRGFKTSEWAKAGRPIIRIQNLTGSRTSFNYFAGEVDRRHEVHPGDLLMSWAATLGVFFWDGPDAVLNQHIFKVESHVDVKFHFYLLQATLPRLLEQAHGSGMVHITKALFDRTRVPLPPPDEQQRIVAAIEEHLSRLDAAGQSLRAAARRLRRFGPSLLASAVTGALIGASWDEWPHRTVAELAVEVRYGTSTRAEEDDAGVPVLRMGNVVDGELVTDRLKYLPSDHPEFPALLLERGDVLFNRTNSPELVGKAAVYRGSPSPCSFASYLIRVRLHDGCAPEVLTYFLNSPYGREWARSVVSQQVGQANINGSKLKALAIRVPPPSEQARLAELVESQLSLMTSLRAALRAAERRADGLRQAVLRDAFAGRLTEHSTARPVEGVPT
jgi:type I restriction enzyme S subunit